MANMYIRVPHYIASYLRNRIEANPIPIGKPINIDLGDPWYMPFMAHAEENVRNIVNIECFSEQQWLNMNRGEFLIPPEPGGPKKIKRDKVSPLTMTEIYTLCGRKELIRDDGDREYTDEYIPFKMPSVIIRRGRECRVGTNWFMPNAKDFVDAVRTQFKMVFVKFVAQDQYYSNSLAALGAGALADTDERVKNRSRMESIDRFMLRYDIRYGDREREALKKILFRAISADAYALDADANHAAWIVRERSRDTDREAQRPVKTREIYVPETDTIYPSINATLRALGCQTNVANRNNLCRAVKMNYRFHGVHVRFADAE